MSEALDRHPTNEDLLNKVNDIARGYQEVIQLKDTRIAELEDSYVSLLKHRDAWRMYAYGKRAKPAKDFLGPVGQTEPTRIEVLEAQRDELRAALGQMRAALVNALFPRPLPAHLKPEALAGHPAKEGVSETAAGPGGRSREQSLQMLVEQQAARIAELTQERNRTTQALGETIEAGQEEISKLQARIAELGETVVTIRDERDALRGDLRAVTVQRDASRECLQELRLKSSKEEKGLWRRINALRAALAGPAVAHPLDGWVGCEHDADHFICAICDEKLGARIAELELELDALKQQVSSLVDDLDSRTSLAQEAAKDCGIWRTEAENRATERNALRAALEKAPCSCRTTNAPSQMSAEALQSGAVEELLEECNRCKALAGHPAGPSEEKLCFRCNRPDHDGMCETGPSDTARLELVIKICNDPELGYDEIGERLAAMIGGGRVAGLVYPNPRSAIDAAIAAQPAKETE